MSCTQRSAVRDDNQSNVMVPDMTVVGFFQAPEGESQPMTEVDLFISTQRIKVLTADTLAE